jgi:hypothetical protein
MPLRMIVEIQSASAATIAGAFILIISAALARKRQALLWWLWLGGTLGFVMLLDLSRETKHLVFLRYASLCAPAVFMLIVQSAQSFQMTRHAVPMVFAIVPLALVPASRISEGEPDWRELGRLIDERVQPDEPIVCYGATMPTWYAQLLYLGSSHYSHAFPHRLVLMSRRADEQLMRSLSSDRAWLISGPPEVPVEQILPGSVVLDQRLIANLAVCTRVRLPRGR